MRAGYLGPHGTKAKQNRLKYKNSYMIVFVRPASVFGRNGTRYNWASFALGSICSKMNKLWDKREGSPFSPSLSHSIILH